jgi:hypothetical protein
MPERRPTMKLWLISQSRNNGYDTFDSAVVAAETEAEARHIHPNSGVFWKNGPLKQGWYSNGLYGATYGYDDTSWALPVDVTVEKVKTHIPDIKAVEGRAPFSFSAVKKMLYQ